MNINIKSIKKKLLKVLILIAIIATIGVVNLASISSRFYPIKGIDVSHHQGTIDWSQVPDKGISFAYIKATEGSGHVDTKLSANYEGAKENGLDFGFYHFLSLESPAQSQFDNYKAAIADYDMTLIPAIDVEWYGDMRQNKPDKDLVIKQVQELSDLMEEEYGVKPLIYTTQTFYFTYLWGEFKDNPLWIRNTACTPVQKFAIWQYTEKLDFEGIVEFGRYVDGNVTNKKKLSTLYIK